MLTDVAVRRRALTLEAENIGLCTDNASLKAENRRLNQEVHRLTARVTGLESTVEKLRRAGKRQAAPHSKGTHVPHPKRSGRRPGEAYGTKAYRKVPDHIDDVVEVPCPAYCDCGGEVEVDGAVEQWIQDIPPVAVRTLGLWIHQGRCRRRGKAIRGRHPDQSSEAAGAAASRPPRRRAGRGPEKGDGRLGAQDLPAVRPLRPDDHPGRRYPGHRPRR